MPAPAHQPFSSISLDLSVPEEAYSRNVRATGTLKFGYEGVFKISTPTDLAKLEYLSINTFLRIHLSRRMM